VELKTRGYKIRRKFQVGVGGGEVQKPSKAKTINEEKKFSTGKWGGFFFELGGVVGGDWGGGGGVWGTLSKKGNEKKKKYEASKSKSGTFLTGGGKKRKGGPEEELEKAPLLMQADSKGDVRV